MKFIDYSWLSSLIYKAMMRKPVITVRNSSIFINSAYVLTTSLQFNLVFNQIDICWKAYIWRHQIELFQYVDVNLFGNLYVYQNPSTAVIDSSSVISVLSTKSFYVSIPLSQTCGYEGFFQIVRRMCCWHGTEH